MNNFKTYIKPIALLVGLIIPTLTNAQVRPDIFSFTSTQRAELADLIIDFVNPDILQYHCDYTTIMNNGLYDIHDDFNFLPFHRTYLEKLEDYLLEQGYPQYVPLPKWTGLVAPPIEFSTAGPNGNGVDPDCGSTTCADAPNNCNPPSNWSGTVSLPIWPGESTSYLSLPVQSGNNNDLCDWNMFPSSFTTINDQTGSNGLSRRIETPWHNQGHGVFGSGAMVNFRSPAVAIFWLWHAAVDDKWREWECNCPQSTTLPFDMYMKDNEYVVQHFRDRGEEPSIDPSGVLWESNDIWVRTQQDGLTNHSHQNPEYYSVSTNFNYVYVQVRNRGCVPTSGTNQLKVYWAKAGTALSYPTHWNGSLTTSNGQPVGDIISTVNLPIIQPGESYIAEIPWQPVDPANYVTLDNSTDPLFWIGSPEPHHFCLLARIESSADPITFTNGSGIGEYVRQNNNVVWKNLSVVDLDPNNIVDPGGWEDDKVFGATVLVGDVLGNGGTFDLEFTNPDFYQGNPVTAEAEVKVTLSPHIWDKWQTGGFQAENVEVVREEKHQVLIKENPARLKNLTFESNERNLVHVGFNFLSKQLSGQEKFKYRVIQRDNTTNQIIGGETYDIKIPGRPGFYADAGGDKEISEGESTDLNAYDIGETAIYNWYDQEGNLIYTGKEFTVSPEITEKYKLEVIADLDGVKDYDEVEVKVKEFEILSMSPNPATNQVNLEYKANNASSAYLMIMKPYGNSYNHILDVNQNQTSINVSSYQTGVYNVILVCNGQAVDASTLVVQ
ncbi:MAG TPA: hypothetical protein ENK91_09695 [Bacteroidetes bacterium]|nr:hypothetical protein [Bacteroidota bacterium]